MVKLSYTISLALAIGEFSQVWGQNHQIQGFKRFIEGGELIISNTPFNIAFKCSVNITREMGNVASENELKECFDIMTGDVNTNLFAFTCAKGIQSDRTMECTIYGERHFFNVLDCVAATCDQTEFFTVVFASEPTIDCKVYNIQDVQDGSKDTSYGYSLGSTASQSATNDTVLGIAIATALSVVIILVAGTLCCVINRKEPII